MMTRRRRAVLTAVVMFIDVAGYPPTVTDLTVVLGLRRWIVEYDLGVLIRFGYLERDPQVARGLRVLDKARPLIPVANASERTAPRAAVTS